MHRPILSIALAFAVSIQGQGISPQTPDRLTEPGERFSNAIQPPDVVMDLIGVTPGLIIGEVGAGRGRVTVHLAARVGETGKVYANDINAASLDYLKDRCKRQGISNVETILSLVDDARFPANRLDLVFMAWVYHHVDKPVPLLKSVLPSLKPWGSVVMVEPIRVETQTKRTARVLTRELVGREAKEAGFELAGMIEGRLKEDNIFVLRPIAPESPDPSDRQKVRGWDGPPT